MKAMFTAFCLIAVVTVGAWWGLSEYAPFSSGENQAGANVRLD